MEITEDMELIPRKYKSKPVEIQAIRFTGINHGAIMYFLGDQLIAMQENEETNKHRFLFKNLHEHADALIANEGDWVVKGIEGEFYPCVNSVFTKKYEPV